MKSSRLSDNFYYNNLLDEIPEKEKEEEEVSPEKKREKEKENLEKQKKREEVTSQLTVIKVGDGCFSNAHTVILKGKTIFYHFIIKI